MNICVFVGARPNFIKVAPVLRVVAAQREQGADIDCQLVFAGCPDDATLEDSLFDDLQISRPDVCLGVESDNLNELTGQVMAAFEIYLQNHPTDAVIVVDDLASTMAAAIVTKKQGLLLAHLSAGTRSFDITMPKEINRLVIDGLSDLLFTAGMSNNSIANREGAEQSKVYMVGNLLIDNLRYNRTRLRKPQLFDDLKLSSGQYIVFTLNRKKLIGDTENLGSMLSAMLRAAGDMPVVAPLRDNAAKVVKSLAASGKLDRCDNLHIVDPLNFLEFSYLMANARGVVTDSGNVAEEATFNAVPCITLNSYTEHIETVKVGTNVLVGEDAERLCEAVGDMVGGNWKPSAIPDRWDGRTAERIVQTICNVLSQSHK